MNTLILIILTFMTPYLIHKVHLTEDINKRLIYKLTPNKLISKRNLLLTTILTITISATIYTQPLPTQLLVYTITLMAGLDLRFKLVPDELSFIILCLAVYNINENMHLYFYLDRMLTAVVVFLLLYAITYLTKGGIGGADIKLFTALALLFGYQHTFLIFCLTYTIGAFIELPRYYIFRTREIALVPYIAVVVYLTALTGDAITV